MPAEALLPLVHEYVARANAKEFPLGEAVDEFEAHLKKQNSRPAYVTTCVRKVKRF
jgi:hypothetical protein